MPSHNQNTVGLRKRHWLISVRPLELAVFLKAALRIRRQEVDVAGLTLWVDPASNFGSRLLNEGSYEADLTNFCRQLLQPGATFFDVGANEGWFSMVACQAVGPNGRVCAVEPQERLWTVILRNASLNRFANLTLLPFGVSREESFASMNLYPSLNSGSSNFNAVKRRFDKVQKVTTTTLEKLIEQSRAERIDLMKIDIEGFELEALKSAGRHLGSTIRSLVVEIHPPLLAARGESEDEVLRLLNERGYRPETSGGVTVWKLPSA
jgi:FkbM family methyltransferase